MTKNGVEFDVIFHELLAAGLNPVVLKAPSEPLTISGVVADSRKVSEGQAFCAIKGSNFDGHAFVVAPSDEVGLAIVESPFPAPEGRSSEQVRAIIRVDSSRAAWAQLESFFCGHPSRQLKMIGITGTNGKTSTVWMIRAVLEAANVRCAAIGTLGIYEDSLRIDSPHTTPDPDVLYPKLQHFANIGITHVAMEVSSHALTQGKVWPISFAAAGFTSFSQDHLDFHKTIEDYLRAKLLLFQRQLSPHGFALFHSSLAELIPINSLIKSGERFETYGSKNLPSCNFIVEGHVNKHLGTSVVAVTPANQSPSGKFEIPMIGDVFAQNFGLAAIIVARISNLPLDKLQQLVGTKKNLAPVPGRLELVRDTNKPWRPLVYVDYAHTPDALEKALHNVSGGGGKLVVVFGCGGDRDKSKRQLMGAIAAKNATTTIVTSDNPRSEDPKDIIRDILAGIPGHSEDSNEEQCGTRVISDRREAIRASIVGQHARDVVLIAGKGHENYQIIGKSKLPFSDQDVALEMLRVPRTWLVFGAGVSGFSAAEHLVRHGERVLLSDDRQVVLPEQVKGLAAVLDPQDIPWEQIQTMVISPGVAPSHPVCGIARQRGIPVISEIDLGLDCYPGKTWAVTGTNGKSTTVAMAEFLAKNLGANVRACGNIGLPPTALDLRNARDSDTVVIELSSYQLEGSLSWAADVAAITSFSFDHLARHKTLEAYFKAKWRVTEWLKPHGLLLVSPDVANYAVSQKSLWPQGRIIVIGQDATKVSLPVSCELIDISNDCCKIAGTNFNLSAYGLRGIHNQSNGIMAALMLKEGFGVSMNELLPRLAEYRGLPFRCEVVYQNSSFSVINDSKSTNLESTTSALSMTKNPAILLMGGQGKGESYIGLSRSASNVRALITFGASGANIASDASSFIKAEVFDKMERAVLRAIDLARENKWDILFSPGCASFDEFRNFEERGLVFNRLIKDGLKDS